MGDAPGKPMNIMWLGVAPWAPTGYGTQMAQAALRMQADGHNVAVSCSTGVQWMTLDWNGIPVYPSDYTGLNKLMLRHHVNAWARDLGVSADEVQVISLFDIWPWVDPKYGGMVADFQGLRMASWLPLDSYPLAPKINAALTDFGVRPIAMSRFGQDTLREAGYQSEYVPHAVDTSVFAPVADRDRCKQAIGASPDQFVVGMVAHNQGMQPARKNFAGVLQAFAVFQQEHDDAVLYLHTEVTGTAFQGLNLVGMARHMGIPESAVKSTNRALYLMNGVSPEMMAHAYSAFDVLASPSYGEGFGLPILEAQACGTPVVVSAYTAMPELCGAGWQVGGQPWYNESSGSMWLHPSTDEILAAFELAYLERGNQALRDQAREFALAYDADAVYDGFWRPALAALDAPREVPPLVPLNRAARRARKVAA